MDTPREGGNHFAVMGEYIRKSVVYVLNFKSKQQDVITVFGYGVWC